MEQKCGATQEVGAGLRAKMSMLLTSEAGPVAGWMLSMPIAALAFFLRVFTLLGVARVFDTGSLFEAGVSAREDQGWGKTKSLHNKTLEQGLPPPPPLFPPTQAWLSGYQLDSHHHSTPHPCSRPSPPLQVPILQLWPTPVPSHTK